MATPQLGAPPTEIVRTQRSSAPSAPVAGGATDWFDQQGRHHVIDSVGDRVIGPIPILQQMLVLGHSYTVGQGAHQADYAAIAKLAAYYNADMIHRGVGGSILAWDQTAQAGGYADVLQNIMPARSAGPYLAEPWIPIILTGINDLGYGKNAPPFGQALRTVICRAMASRVFENDDASVTYPSGTWSAATASVLSNSGAGYRTLTTATGSLQIAVPADFEGGAIDLGFVVVPSAKLGVISGITVDGVAKAVAGTSPTTLSGRTYTSGTAYKSGIVVRLTGLTAGAHTIVVSFTGNSGGGGVDSVNFDYWQIEASDPPPAFVANIARLLTAGYAVYPATVPTDADVATWNAQIATDLAEFAHVHIVDIDTALAKSTANFASDGVHPNERGYVKIAAAFATEIDKYLANRTTEQAMMALKKPPSTQNHAVLKSSAGANISLSASAAWTLFPNLGTGAVAGSLIEASIGDTIEITPGMFIDATGTAYCLFDTAFCTSAGVPLRYFSSETSTPLALGWTPWFAEASKNAYIGPPAHCIVQKADIAYVGHVFVRLFYKLGSASARNALQGSGSVLAIEVKNLGRKQAVP